MQDTKIEVLSIIESFAQEETLEMYILNHHVTASDVEQAKHGKYLDKNFLSAKGIKKDSTSADKLSAKYFQNKPLTDNLKRKWDIKGIYYTPELFSDNTGQHTTYYCFIKQDPDSLK